MFWSSKRTSGRRASRRRLSFEQCESRRLMAVTTALNSGTLTIIGDADADDIAIVGTANPGEITIAGRNGTLVDGVANGSTTISGVTADLFITLEEGDDVVDVDNVFLAGDLDILTEFGNDRLTLGATGVVSTGGHCILNAGHGNNVIRAEDYHVFIVGFLSVQGGEGYDSMAITGASSLTSVNVQKFGGASGLDALLRGVTSAGPITVSAHADINSVAILTSAASAQIDIIAFGGKNSFYLDTNYAGSFLRVNAATDFFNFAPVNEATVTVARCQTAQLVIQTSRPDPRFRAGDDQVMAYGNLLVGPPQLPGSEYPAALTSVLFIATGGGNDTVDLTYNVAQGNIFVSLATGNDTLSLGGNVGTGFANFDGGDGGNLLNNFGNQFGGFAAARFH